MLSAWSDPIEVYLGLRLSMMRRRGAIAVVYPHAQTLPLTRVLSGLSERASTLFKRPTRLRIHLSAALCPAISLAFPQGLRAGSERLAFIRAACAREWGTDALELVCIEESQGQSIAAALPRRVLEDLRSWAAAQRCRISMLRPLWADATRAKAARQSCVAGLVVWEPDATTVIANANKALVASTFPATPDQARQDVIAYQLKLDLAAASWLNLSFSSVPPGLDDDMPLVWKGHWGQS